MKRMAVLVAAVVGAGCSVSTSGPASPPSYDNVTVYWTFWHTDSSGTPVSLTCSQAGVDSVYVVFSDGYTATVSCAPGSATFSGFASGSYWVSATGYRNGVAPALYDSGAVGFTKVAGVDAAVYVDVPGIAAALELAPVLDYWNGSAYVQYSYPSCTSGSIDTITYAVNDGAGITLAQGQESCVAGYDPASLLFSAIEMDTLFIRMQGWWSGSLVMDSCTTSFGHFATDTGAYGDVVHLYDPIPSPCP